MNPKLSNSEKFVGSLYPRNSESESNLQGKSFQKIIRTNSTAKHGQNTLISLSHAMRPGLKSPPFLGGKIIELAKFCFMNKRFETNLSFFSKPVIVCHCM